MNGTLFRLLALSLATLALPACHVSRPADPARRATAPLPPADAWPARDLGVVRELSERTPETVRPWELSGTVPEEQLAETSRKALDSVDRTVTANRLTEHGLLRVWSYPESDEDRFSANRLFGGGFLENASFLTSRDASGYRLERAMEGIPGTLGAPRLEENASYPGLQYTFARQSVMLDAGIDLRIPDRVRGRGVLVVLGALFSTPWQEDSIDLFERAGWDVVRIDPATGTRRPDDSESERALDRRRAFVADRIRNRPAAQPEREARESALNDAKTAFPLSPSAFTLAPERDPEAVGRAIARAIDESIAENAYAAHAAVDHLIDTHGRDALGPIAVLGYSVGSLAAPAAAARLETDGVRVGALILIGSGADLFTISRTSTRTNGGIDLTGGGESTPTEAQITAARDAYLEHAALDPHALGPALRNIPTLLMIASRDRMVPNGELLDERLGEPDRVRYFGGHGGLFYFLPQQTPRMVRWLDAVTGPGSKVHAD